MRFELCTVAHPIAVTSCPHCQFVSLPGPLLYQKGSPEAETCVLHGALFLEHKASFFLIHQQLTHIHKAPPHTHTVDITACHHPFPSSPPTTMCINRRCQRSAVTGGRISKQVIVIITVNPFISLNTHTKAPLAWKCLRDSKSLRH